MMTLIEFIYDRNYPARISADGGSTHFAPGLVEEIFEAYAQYKAENLPISGVTQWVATSDRLPEEGKVVIVWLPDVKDTDLDKICEYTTKEQFKRHYSHWMAYPEPPCG